MPGESTTATTQAASETAAINDNASSSASNSSTPKNPEPFVGAAQSAGAGAAETSAAEASPAKTSGEGANLPDGGAKPEGEGEKPAPRAPEAYGEFTIPEGTILDEQSATEFKGLAKELDLTQEQAQKLLDFGGARIRAVTDEPHRLWAETQAKWQAEVKADPEIGGTRFKDSIAAANNVFVPGESNPFVKNAAEAGALRSALHVTGAGNNPTMVRLFVKMGRMLSEPGTLAGSPLRDTQDSLLAKMYPMMTETNE
jgi:hypothetical protein